MGIHVRQKQVKTYLTELKMIGSSVHTLQNYGYHLDKFIAYTEENNLDYTELTPKQVKNFRNHLVEQGLKPRTINAILAELKSFYDPQRHHRAGDNGGYIFRVRHGKGVSPSTKYKTCWAMPTSPPPGATPAPPRKPSTNWQPKWMN